MKINILERPANIEDNEVNIIIETKGKSPVMEEFVNYVMNYNKRHKRVTVMDGDIIKVIDCDDIICFYSEGKNNFCKTSESTYKIRSKLYEIEKLDDDFIRISKNCIINAKHLDKCDMSRTGRITIQLDDKTEKIVSRRKAKKISNLIEKRIL